ncbi:MAG: NADPH-dependent curcumin reductase CurA [Halieaceae bacterium]|jgi:NADPH-dependent curcumin reductase CurA
MTKKLRQVVLERYPDGIPVAEDFRLVEVPLPEPGPGEVLCETLYLSLDPYMRSQIAGRHLSGTVVPGDAMRGETVSRVIASHVDAIPVGTLVRCFGGWRSHSVHPQSELFPLPGDFPAPSLALSTLGMPGLTAWAGLHCLANPVAGETVVIPAATGGVGAVAGQLAKAQGCRVIGIAGSDEKCLEATKNLGYDACINRHTDDVAQALRQHCPDGINVYFDLVGGPLLTAASKQLAIGARVLLCGLMADYNSNERPAGPPPGLWIVARAIVYGLVVYDFEVRRDEFLAEAIALLKAGRLRSYEDRSQGLDSAPAAFCRLMNGENHGKTVVCLAE